MNVLGIFSLPDWLAVVIILITLAYIDFIWNFGYWKKQNVKTGFYGPILGSLWMSLFSTVHEIDAKNYKVLGKIWGSYDIRYPTLLVGDLELIKLITVKDFHSFPERRRVPLCGKSKITRLFLTIMDGGEEWKFHRSVLSPTFTSGKLRQMGNLMEECGDQLVRNLHRAIKAEPDDMDVKNMFGLYSMDIIASCCFGYKINVEDANDSFVLNAKKLTNGNFVFAVLMLVLMPKLAERLNVSIFPADVLTYFEKVIHQVVEMRKKETFIRNDFLQLLLDAQAETKQSDQSEAKFSINEEAVVAHSMLFLIAGFDTTANSICLAIYLLSLNPECQDRLIQEIDEALEEHGKLTQEIVMDLRYLDMVVAETLRYFPLAARIERRCNQDYNLGGFHLKEGMIVAIPVWSIHHSEEYYPNPEKFDPERFTPENKAKRNPLCYMPFGSGPRNCIGMRFALMQVKMAIAKFFTDFRVSPSGKTQIPMKFRKGMPLLLPTDGFHLKIEKRRD